MSNNIAKLQFATVLVLIAPIIAIAGIRDPIEIEIPVAPSALNSGASAIMNFSSVTVYSSYQITCEVTNLSNDDPVYFTEQSDMPHMCKFGGTQCGKMFADGVAQSKLYDAILLSPGKHAITFNYYLSSNFSPPDKKDIYIYNASSDLINIDACYAEFN